MDLQLTKFMKSLQIHFLIAVILAAPCMIAYISLRVKREANVARLAVSRG